MGKKGGAASTQALAPAAARAPTPKVKAPEMKQQQKEPQLGSKATDKAEKKAKRKCSDIDDIFGMASRGAAGEEPTAAVESNDELKEIAERIKKAREAKLKEKEETPAPPRSKAAKLEGSKDDLFGSDAGKSRKRTEEGFAIYTEDELKLGSNGGDTELCPFDCDCCF